MKILLIILILLLISIILLFFYTKRKISNFLNKNFGMNFYNIVEEVKKTENNEPKSIASLESITLPTLAIDFPELNINELKSMAEAKIIECLNCIENKEYLKNEITTDKVVNWINSKIDDYKDKNVKYEEVKIHKTALNRDEKTKAMATLYFQTSLEYYMSINGERKKVQDRYKTEFIYVIDGEKFTNDKKLIGLNCPNCGAPIKNLGYKNCSYCGTGIVDFVKKTWVLSNILQF